jgi:hypothetical protein
MLLSTRDITERRDLLRAPVSLDFACGVIGMTWREFLRLLVLPYRGRQPYLTVYRGATDAGPSRVDHLYYEQILKTLPFDASAAQFGAHIPQDHFVWADELVVAFSQLTQDCLREGEACVLHKGQRLNPHMRFLGGRKVEGGVDLAALVQAMFRTALSRKELSREEIQDYWEHRGKEYYVVEPEDPMSAAGAVPQKIDKLTIIGGRSTEAELLAEESVDRSDLAPASLATLTAPTPCERWWPKKSETQARYELVYQGYLVKAKENPGQKYSWYAQRLSGADKKLTQRYNSSGLGDHTIRKIIRCKKELGDKLSPSPTGLNPY